MKNQKFKLEIGGRNLEVQIRNLASRANGEVMVSYGDTMILATCVMSEEEKKGLGFFPLTVNYEERFYAAGKIYGSRYIRRESRPSDEATTNARLIDRTIRPRFPKNLNREVQVVVTVLSWDRQNDPDILGLLAASLVLSISDIPWLGPLAGLRVARIKEGWVLNPTYENKEENELDIVLAGALKDKEVLINMIEASAQEISEDLVLEAFEFSKKYFEKLIAFQKDIIKKIGKEKIAIEVPIPDFELEKEIKEFLGEKLEKVLFQKENEERMDDVNNLKKELVSFIEEKYPDLAFIGEKTQYALDFFEKEIDGLVHENAIKQGKRSDNRKPDEIRELQAEVSLLPRTHGSGLFCRGQTKALSILTLGAPEDQQLLEGMEIVGKKRFMHHYNFPPYSVGEVTPMRGPSRRDIGHGMLVEKALLPLLPSFDEFPYTIRIVSEMLSSNGSTSMASVSSSSLSLMDAGVPIKRPGAGIAIGLMKDEKGEYKILTDIQGPEDHHGDMDLKIAGTRKGITAIQMDVKIEGITKKIFKEALSQAKKARHQILDLMEKIIPKSRPQLSPYAPRVYSLQINPEKIGEVIGPGGRVINEIIRETGVTIDVQQTGMVYVTSENEESAKKAISWIKNLTREVKVGDVFQGKVTRILNFGAMVEILPNQEGLIHISKLSPKRIEKVEDAVKVGETVSVKVISIDEQGRINLAFKEGGAQRRFKRFRR